MSRTTALMLALMLALPASGAEKFDPEARARAVAPFLDEQTFLIIHVDLTHIDPDALRKQLAEITHLEVGEVIPGQARRWLVDFTRAGGKEIYLVSSLADLGPGQPLFAVVPLTEGADAPALSRLLAGGPRPSPLGVATVGRAVWGRTEDTLSRHPSPSGAARLGRAVVGGSEETLNRLRNLKPAPRPETAEAFAAAGDSTAQVLLLPPAYARRIVGEMMPTLPPELGGTSSKPLTHGLRWAALGVQLAPAPSLRLVIQSPDAASARALKDLLAGSLEALGRQKEVRRLFPEFHTVAAHWTPKVAEDRLVLTLDEKGMAAVLRPAAVRARQVTERDAVVTSLKHLALAVHASVDSYNGRLPAVANFDGQGRPLLSWRVHLLPFLDQDGLYKEFHLDEPWDSEHNRKLIPRMPAVYQGPNRKLNRAGKTIFLAPVGPATLFPGGSQRLRFPQDVPDGTSNTILLVEADDEHAVTWTRPEDLKHDPAQPARGLGGHFQGGFLAALADGSVAFVLTATKDRKALEALFTRNGGEVVGPDLLQQP